MVRYRPFLPALVALVAALVLTAPREEPRQLLPGIEPDEAAVASLREVWSRKTDWTGETQRRLRERAAAIGEPASRALLQIVLEDYARDRRVEARVGDRQVTVTVSGDDSNLAGVDEHCEPEGIVIGELASNRTARALARAVADRGLPVGARRAMIVALCRPRFTFAAGALARVACDRRQPPAVRRAVLLRFHRLECAAPASLRDLLYQSYGGLDILAAAALAMGGDPLAPSLVREGLAVGSSDHDVRYLCTEAVERVVGRELDLPELWGKGEVIDGKRVHSDEDRLEPILAGLDEWIASRPESAFERERREYLASAQRKRERALGTFEQLAAVDDFDIAAASLKLTSRWEGEVVGTLERLHRLCLLCERRLEGARGAEAKIAVLNGLLASFGHETDERASDLPLLLAADDGNCVAHSVLYLAVAQRLGLPVQAYSLPGHVYVAWEEGGRRRNIETTDAGSERPGGGRRLLARELLSLQLSNRAGLLHDLEEFAAAVEFADRALVLDSANPSAHHNRALAVWHLDLEFDPRPDIDRAEELEPGQAGRWIVSSEIARKLGFAKDALRRAEAAVRIEETGRSFVAESRACMAVGEPARAREIADEAGRRWPDSDEVKRLLFDLSLDREDRDPFDRPDIPALWVARALLDRASPARALAFLDRQRDWIVNGFDFRLPDASTAHAPAIPSRCREFRLLEAQALAKLGRTEDARAALRAAEEAAPAVRETLEVRKLLEGR